MRASRSPESCNSSSAKRRKSSFSTWYLLDGTLFRFVAGRSFLSRITARTQPFERPVASAISVTVIHVLPVTAAPSVPSIRVAAVENYAIMLRDDAAIVNKIGGNDGNVDNAAGLVYTTASGTGIGLSTAR